MLAGLYMIWHRARNTGLLWSNKQLLGTLLLGWGIFNLAEGVVDHEVLGLHRVNETVPLGHRIYWDIGFLAWGVALAVAGAAITRAGTREMANAESGLQAR